LRGLKPVRRKLGHARGIDIIAVHRPAPLKQLGGDGASMMPSPAISTIFSMALMSPPDHSDELSIDKQSAVKAFGGIPAPQAGKSPGEDIGCAGRALPQY
jgi:hypothetical protein